MVGVSDVGADDITVPSSIVYNYIIDLSLYLHFKWHTNVRRLFTFHHPITIMRYAAHLHSNMMSSKTYQALV